MTAPRAPGSELACRELHVIACRLQVLGLMDQGVAGGGQLADLHGRTGSVLVAGGVHCAGWVAREACTPQRFLANPSHCNTVPAA